MGKAHDSTHLTIDERQTIQTGIINGSTKKSIAETMGKIQQQCKGNPEVPGKARPEQFQLCDGLRQR